MLHIASICFTYSANSWSEDHFKLFFLSSVVCVAFHVRSSAEKKMFRFSLMRKIPYLSSDISLLNIWNWKKEANDGRNEGVKGFIGQKTSKDLSEWTCATSDGGFADLVDGSEELAVSPVLCVISSGFLFCMLQPWTLTLGSGRSLHCWTSSTRSGGSSLYLLPLQPTITTASRWPTYRWSTTGRTTMSDGSWLCCCFVAQTEAKHW